MITVRPAAERGHANHGWLDTWHTFSFGDYYDPAHMGFSALRVINDDRIAPSGGFPTHGHRDMEIVTYVLSGALQHRDSLGNGSVIRPGEVQRMTAGTGIRHSEFNASGTEPVHLLQIWLLPERSGLTPGYEQRRLPDQDGGGFRLVASHDGSNDSVTIHQDAALYVARIRAGAQASLELPPTRRFWVHLARGQATLNGTPLAAGDGAAVENEPGIRVSSDSGAEVLAFELP